MVVPGSPAYLSAISEFEKQVANTYGEDTVRKLPWQGAVVLINLESKCGVRVGRGTTNRSTGRSWNVKPKLILLALLGFCRLQATNITEMRIDADGTTADLLIDQGGSVTCNGACGGLAFTGFVPPHGLFTLSGTIGGYDINGIAASGGLGVPLPTLAAVTQIVTSSGPGTLTIVWSDTDFGLLGGGVHFGPRFGAALTSNPDASIRSSTLTALALADVVNTLGNGVGLFSAPVVLTGVDAFSTVVGNHGLSTGSVSLITQMNFSGAGLMQSGFTVSTNGATATPETGTLGLLALGLVGLCVRVRRVRRS